MRVETITDLFINHEIAKDKDDYSKSRMLSLKEKLENKNDAAFKVEIDKDKLISAIESMDDIIFLGNDFRSDEEDILLQVLSKALSENGNSISDVVDFKRLDIENILHCLTKDKNKKDKRIETVLNDIGVLEDDIEDIETNDLLSDGEKKNGLVSVFKEFVEDVKSYL